MHIVFQQAGKEVLEQGFAPDETIDKNIINLKSDYSLGPVEFPVSDVALEKRNDWWKKIISDESDLSFTRDNEEDIQKINEIKTTLENNENEELWIWIAPNKQDVSGYYFLLSQLIEQTDKVFVVWLNNLPFINEKGHIFYPRYLSEIPSREFLKAKKLFRSISGGEVEVDIDEWGKLCEENKTVRILKDHKKLAQFDEEYFDKTINNFITADWLKVSKVIQQFNHKSLDIIPEEYLLWRIRSMIENNEIESQGEVTNRKEWEVKKGIVAENNPE
jgi:hypothetical protein